MRIPLKYNIRSLLVRRTGSLMTATGIGLAVAVVVAMLAMVRGLDLTFLETGDEQHLVVIRKGSENETNSYFPRELFDVVRFLPGVARSEDNQPLAVGELIVVINHVRKDGSESNFVVRGTSDMGFRLRPGIRVVEGRKFEPGLREVIVGRSLSRRFRNLALGDSLEVHGTDWKVVAIFDSGGDVHESEVWTGHQDVADVWQRPTWSSVLLRAESAESARKLAGRISEDRRIQLDALTTKAYYAAQTGAAAIGLKPLITLIALFLGIGSCFGIMNMMYGAVIARQQEVATLRTLGFRRRSILQSFLVESAMVALVGGVLGCLLGSLLNGYSAGTSNFASFSEVVFTFRVTPDIVGYGMVFAVTMGLIGGFLPALRAARLRLADALRQ